MERFAGHVACSMVFCLGGGIVRMAHATFIIVKNFNHVPALLGIIR